jgi:hypothetical protein
MKGNQMQNIYCLRLQGSSRLFRTSNEIGKYAANFIGFPFLYVFILHESSL